jgi:hypothetical protein
MLRKFEERNFVSKGCDHKGRRSWVIESEGHDHLIRELSRKMRVNFLGNKKSQNAVDYIRRARMALAILKKAGYRDIQAREALIRYPIYRIEFAISMARRNAKGSEGGYIRTILENRRGKEERARFWMRKAVPDISEDIRSHVISNASGGGSSFFGIVQTAAPVIRDRSEQFDVTTWDVDEIFTDLNNARKFPVKGKRRRGRHARPYAPVV